MTRLFSDINFNFLVMVYISELILHSNPIFSIFLIPSTHSCVWIYTSSTSSLIIHFFFFIPSHQVIRLLRLTIVISRGGMLPLSLLPSSISLKRTLKWVQNRCDTSLFCISAVALTHF